MKLGYFRTLEGKFILMATTIILFASTAANFLIFRATKERVIEDAHRRASLLTEATAISFTNTLIYQEVGLVEEGGLMENHIAGLLSNEEAAVLDVVVFNSEGRTIAANNYKWYHVGPDHPVLQAAMQATNLEIVPDLRHNPQEVEVVMPLQIGGKRFGSLVMQFSLQKEFAYLAAFRNRLLLLTLVGMVISILLAIFIAKTLAQPIKRLLAEMSQISTVNLQSGLISRRSDEIGQLERGFLRMLRRLRKAAAEKEKSQQALIQAEKLAALGTLVAGVAHEINNPLAGLYNCLRRIETAPDDTSQTKKYAGLMRKALRHIETTVQNLLNFARQNELTTQPVNLNAIILNAVELLHYKMKKHGIDLKLDLAENLPAIHGDEIALEQVFLNLFLNAIDAMAEQGRLEVASQAMNGEVVVEVKDSGHGIPEKELAHIFDPFYTKKDVGKGTGLGLSVVRGIVSNHRGHIDVQSIIDKGSTFRLRFPVISGQTFGREARVCAAVLAGGQSSRMGENKALLELNGQKMIEHVTSKVKNVAQEVVLITNTPQDYKFLEIPCFPDEIRGVGPLGGIYTALRRCKASHCLIVACDLPFLSEKLLRFLIENAGKSDIFAIDSGNGAEPLCAVYSRSCLPAIEKLIAAKEYRVKRLFEKVRARVMKLKPEEMFQSDLVFYNVNTPEQWRHAGTLAETSDGSRENASPQSRRDRKLSKTKSSG